MQYLLSENNGSIPQSVVVCRMPYIQAYNKPLHDSPIPFITCHEPVSMAFTEDFFSLSELEQTHFDITEMKCPVLFNVEHLWRVFGISLDFPYGPWMFDLSGWLPLELAPCRSGGLAFKASWVREVKNNLEDAAAAINSITLHRAYVPGNPLPCCFDVGLLSATFTTPEQACNVHSLAIIMMGELITYINQWRLTLGGNWSNTLSHAI